IELDGDRSHLMLEAGALKTGVKVVAQFIAVVPGQLAAQERGDVIGLDRMDRRADQGVVERTQRSLAVEDEVRGILDLHQAPVVGRAKLRRDRAIARRPAVEGAMESFDREGVSERLRPGKVADVAEGVVES